MKVIENLDQLQGKYKDVVLTLGNFDGVHLGHQEILKRVFAYSKKHKCPSVVFTFQEHPLKVLGGNSPSLLTTVDEKKYLLEKLGIDVVVCIPFTQEIASCSAKQFINKVLYSLLQPQMIIVGHDYAFGENRSGDAALLEHCGKHYGYRVEVVDAFEVSGVTVSSTVIRQKIAQGKVEEAASLLGYSYSLRSEVITGQQKGTGLNFRTANMGGQPKLLPGCGVYAVRVQLEGETHQGVANIGFQPTYGQNELQVEVHLLDLNTDIYGRKLRVSFIGRLRDEQKFPNQKALNEQINKDVCLAKQILGVNT